MIFNTNLKDKLNADLRPERVQVKLSYLEANLLRCGTIALIKDKNTTSGQLETLQRLNKELKQLMGMP